MFLDFTKRWSQSYVNKTQTRFWSLIRFAAREPYSVRLSFTKDDVPSYGGNDARHVERTLPTVSDLRKILKAADLREQTWVWLGLGCAFGPQDIARCKPIHFDEHDFDLRRGKTGVDRYGPMFPMVWSHLQLHMAQHPPEPDDLLFRTRKGKPVVWVAAKKPDAKKGKVSYTKVSALRMAWLDLLKRSKPRWQGSFYTLRHLGGTSYGSRPNVSIVALRDFMGHTNINTTNRYLKAVTPRSRKLIEWITVMLDEANADAWHD